MLTIVRTNLKMTMITTRYASSPDGSGGPPEFSSLRISSRFSSIPESSYPGPKTTQQSHLESKSKIKKGKQTAKKNSKYFKANCEGPVNAAEAKERMMAMEAQLSQVH